MLNVLDRSFTVVGQKSEKCLVGILGEIMTSNAQQDAQKRYSNIDFEKFNSLQSTKHPFFGSKVGNRDLSNV